MSNKTKRVSCNRASSENHINDMFHADETSQSSGLINTNVSSSSSGINANDIKKLQASILDVSKIVQNMQTNFASDVVVVLKSMASYAPHVNNIEESEIFLSQRNLIRQLNGKPPVNYIYCRHCNAINNHLPNKCPAMRCNICLQYGHTANICSYGNICQFCNSKDHPSIGCSSELAIKLRAMKNKVCFACGSSGHVASQCKEFNARQDYGNKRHKHGNKRGKLYRNGKRVTQTNARTRRIK
jgi:hypothetical protein